jgi:hypothetical protein
MAKGRNRPIKDPNRVINQRRNRRIELAPRTLRIQMPNGRVRRAEIVPGRIPVPEPAKHIQITPELESLIQGGAIIGGMISQGAFDISNIYDILRVEENNPGAPRNGTRWHRLQRMFADATDAMKGRGGDLIHDIKNAVFQKVANSNISMLDFLLSLVSANNKDNIKAILESYARSEALILNNFNNFRKNQFKPEIVKRTAADLSTFTNMLRENGVTTVIQDSMFGNVYSDGFGKGLIVLLSAVSYADGSTKISPRTLASYGVACAYDKTPFVLPDFYRNINTGESTQHTIFRDLAKYNAINIKYGDINVTAACKSGFSVNALAKISGIEAPRNSGGIISPVVMRNVIEKGSTALNHVMMIKPLTDWAQIIYALLLNLYGIRTIVITCDAFFVALAAALGLPYVIRTPSPTSDYIEFYQFDPSFDRLSDEQTTTIQQKFVAGGEEYDEIERMIVKWRDEYTDNTIKCMRRNKVPESIIQKFIYDDDAARGRVTQLLQYINPIAIPADLSMFRSLLHMSYKDYVFSQMKYEISYMYNIYNELGSHLQYALNTAIVTDPTTLGNIYSELITFFGNAEKYGAVKNVLSSFRGVPGKISVWGLPEGNRPIVSAYFKYHIETAAGINPGEAPYYIEPAIGTEWTNPSLTLKQALWEMIKDEGFEDLQDMYNVPQSLCVMAGGGEGEEGNVAGVETLTIGEVVDNWVAYYMSEPDEYPNLPDQKLSCIENLPDLIMALSTNGDPAVIDSLIGILSDIGNIDARESNMLSEYTVALSDIRDLRDELSNNSITIEDFAYEVLFRIFENPAMMFITDIITMPVLKHLIMVLMRLADKGFTPSVNIGVNDNNLPIVTFEELTDEQLQLLSNTGILPTATSDQRNLGRLAREEERRREERKPVEKIPPRSGLGFPGSREMRISNLPKSTVMPGTEFVTVTSSTSSSNPPGVKRGGARRSRKHLRRTRKRGAAAARRKRTIRRRK